MSHLRCLAACLFLSCVANTLFAGAWQREPGSGFVSLTQRLSWPQDTTTWQSYDPTARYTSLYLEYGITSNLSIGLDFGLSVSGADKNVAFLQFPIRQTDKGPRLAAQVGFGRIAEEKVLRPGVSIGWGRRHGWLAADAIAEVPFSGGPSDIKIDITWGRNLPKDRQIIVQLHTGNPAEDPPFVRIEPSLVRPLFGPLRVETGFNAGLLSDQSMGLKLGVFANF